MIIIGIIIVIVFFSGTKLQWSSAITLSIFIWLFTAFWSAMPLIGWGEYDYEPLRTCCTLDYSKGDRYGLHKNTMQFISVLYSSMQVVKT